MASLSSYNLSHEKRRSDGIRSRIRSGGGPSVYGSPTGFSGGGFGGLNDLSQAARQYAAFRDIPYAAIRPICVHFASQPVRVAIIPRRAVRGNESARINLRKSLRREGLIGDCNFELRQKQLHARMPLHVKSSLPPDAVVLDSHEIIDAIENGNDTLNGWQTKYLTAASLMLAGRALLTWNQGQPVIGGDSVSEVHYIPMHWAEPRHDEGPYSGWTIRPIHGGEAVEVKRGGFIYMAMSDPGDPLSAVSPTQAQAKSINTSDKIHDAHYHGLNNLIRPSYAISLGKIPSPDGQPSRPYVKSGQRRKITDLVKSYVGGVMNRGEPILLDALIDDIKAIGASPTDLDYVGGGDLVERRLMQGYGVSPIIAGFSQNANRAGSHEAHKIFYRLIINPLLSLSGNAHTHALGPLFDTDQYRIRVYYDAATADDEDARRSRVALFKDRLSDVEARKYMRTGEVDWDDEEVPTGGERGGVSGSSGA